MDRFSKRITTIIFFVSYFLAFYGCEDSHKVELSSGKEIGLEQIKEMESLDKISYVGLENVFSDTKIISPNGKPLLLIFAKNNCIYCDKFKDNLKADPTTQAFLAENFSSYYINTDYKKTHEIRFGEKSFFLQTLQLAKHYSINPTPTFVFSDSLGNAFFSYPGYLKPKQFYAVLERLKDVKVITQDGIKALSSELFALIETTR